MQDGPQNEPGWVFKPGDTPEQSPELPNIQTPVVEAAPAETPPLEPQAPAQPASFSSAAHVEWTASEYIANPKSAGWFGMLVLGSLVLAGLAYVVTKDFISTAIIPVLGIIVGIFAARQPQVLGYKIDSKGIYIGSKFYPYSSFKSFSVAQEHAMGFISLMPLKRFMPPLAVHYAPDDEEHIVQTLAEYLPYEEHKSDVVDNLTRRFRF